MPQTKTAQAQKYLTSLAYPCTKKELADHAKNLGASYGIVQAIMDLPYDYFTTPYAVREAMGG